MKLFKVLAEDKALKSVSEKYRGIDRLAYLGLVVALIAYFVIVFFILDGVKISPRTLLSQYRKMSGFMPEDLYPWLGINGLGNNW